MEGLFTTPQASEMTGIPQGTIRSWLSRYTDVFQIDKHVVIEKNGRKLWTEDGIRLLRERESLEGEGENAAKSDAFITPSDFVETLLQQSSQELALQFFSDLPKRTVERIKEMMNSPTQQERIIVRNSVQQAISLGKLRLLNPPPEMRELPYAED